MNSEISNTQINSSTNKVKRRSVGTNTDGNFESTSCMNCFQEINQPKIYFVPYVTCMNNPCFQNNMAGTINACKCSSQTNVYDHETAFQCSHSVHANRSPLPPWEKHIGDNNERVSNTCQPGKMEYITEKVSKNNLSVSISTPTVNVNNSNLPKQSHIPHRTLARKTGNRLSNIFIGVERHTNELVNQNSRFQNNDKVEKNGKINGDSKIYKLLVPSSSQGSDSDENFSASEDEETEEENAFNMNINQLPEETMLMMMKALISDRDATKRDFKINKLLTNLGKSRSVGKSPNENMDSHAKKSKW